MNKLIFLLIVFALFYGCSRSPSRSTLDKLSPEEIFDSNSGAVVLIRVYDKDGNMVSFGSGVNIHPEGKIITNLHILKSDCFDFDIKFQKHGVYEDAHITGISPILEDYIILKVNGKNLPSVKVSTRAEYDTGEKVFTIGNPKGFLNSLSDGLVSGKRKYGALEYYQMTASVSHGSSGGAVLDEYGYLVGISTAIIEDGQSLNFFIPINIINNAEIFDTDLTIGKFNSLRKDRAKEYKKTADKFLLSKDYEQAITDYEISLKYYDSYVGAQNINDLIDYYYNGGDLATYNASKSITGDSLSFKEKLTVDTATLTPEKEAAINLVRNSNVFGGISVDAKIKKVLGEEKGNLDIIGWEAGMVNDQTYIVNYSYIDGSGAKGWAFEVNLNGGLVRKVQGDIALEEKYGLRTVLPLDTKDVRNAAWGMNSAEVKNSETFKSFPIADVCSLPGVFEKEEYNYIKDLSAKEAVLSRLFSGYLEVTYFVIINSIGASIIYTFDGGEKDGSTSLSRAYIQFNRPKEFDYQMAMKEEAFPYFMGEFKNIKYILEKQYGKVNTDVTIRGAQNSDYYRKSYTNKWETNTTTIEHVFSSEDYLDIPRIYTHSIRYNSKHFGWGKLFDKSKKIEMQEGAEGSTNNKNQKEDLDKTSFSVFTNKDSNVFHKRNCPKLDTKDDLVEFGSPQEASKAGGLPCNYCNP